MMRSLRVVVYLCLCLLNINQSSGANILFFFGVSTYSHRIRVWPLVEKLADNGHNVTFFSPYLPKEPNDKVNEFAPKALQELFMKIFGSGSNILQRRLDGTHTQIWNDVARLGNVVCDIMGKDNSVREWVKNSQFDLVIINALFNDCGLGLAYYFKAPFIIYGTSSVFMWHYDALGMPAETSTIPTIEVAMPMQMSFWQKVENTLRPLAWYFGRHVFLFQTMEDGFRKAFNVPEMPPFSELEQNASLVLLTNHFSLDYARSLPPLVVSIGGIQIEENNVKKSKALPKELRTFIEESGTQGFIYVSYGSAIQIAKMKREFQQIFFNAFAKSNVKFVWKWEGDRPQEMPDNVFTASWIPQQQVLAQPNIRGFITHGGLLSIEEAAYHAVPLIVMPVFADQDYNAERVEVYGYGIRMEFSTLTESQLRMGIQELLNKNEYAKQMQKISNVFKDRPEKPIDTAVWWTEYVLRHKDTEFLRPLASKQTWYERRSLDVWGFLAMASIMALLGLTKSTLWTGRVVIHYASFLQTLVRSGPARNSSGRKKKHD